MKHLGRRMKLRGRVFDFGLAVMNGSKGHLPVYGYARGKTAVH